MSGIRILRHVLRNLCSLPSPPVQASWETATPWSTLPSWCLSFASVPNRARPWRQTSSAGGWSSGKFESHFRSENNRYHTCVAASVHPTLFIFLTKRTTGHKSKLFSRKWSRSSTAFMLQPFPFCKGPLNFTLPLLFFLLCLCFSPTGLYGGLRD